MSLVKDLACKKKSKSARHPRSLSPHRNGEALARAIAALKPEIPPQSATLRLAAARRAEVSFLANGHPASGAAVL